MIAQKDNLIKHIIKKIHLSKDVFNNRDTLIKNYYLYNINEYLAGVAGFEPTHAGVRIQSLTAWLHPKVILLCNKIFINASVF